jgi:hypothetical protein
MRASRTEFESAKACVNATVEASAPVRLSPILGRPAHRHPRAARAQQGTSGTRRGPRSPSHWVAPAAHMRVPSTRL